jgi:hypothetical protein
LFFFSTSYRYLKVYGKTSNVIAVLFCFADYNCTDRLSNLHNPESPPLNKEKGNNPLIHSYLTTIYIYTTSPLYFICILLGYYKYMLYSMDMSWLVYSSNYVRGRYSLILLFIILIYYYYYYYSYHFTIIKLQPSSWP